MVVSMGREKCWGAVPLLCPESSRAPGGAEEAGLDLSQYEDREVEACVGCPDVRTGSFHSGAQLPHSDWLDPC